MPEIFVDFRPAEVVSKKETYVSFYVLNPYTGKLERKRVRCNHAGSKTNRLRYARLLCQAINERLFMGWNPFIEEAPNSSTTVREALAKFMAEKSRTLRQRTVECYRSYVSIFTQWLASRDMDRIFCIRIDRNLLMSFLRWCDETKSLSNRSYNNYVMFLFTLFDWLAKKGYSTENHAANIPRRKVDRKTRVIIPKCDRAVIGSWVKANCPRYWWAMQLCYRLFIRPQEICGLKIGYFDTRNKLLKIPSHLAKNHCDRVLGVPDDIIEYVESLSAYPDTHYVFADRNTYAPGPKHMKPTRIAEKWKEMRDALKLPASYQFYSLKDTGITEMLEAGVPAKYVKELADHHSLEMTEKYTHRSEAKKILEWNRLEF